MYIFVYLHIYLYVYIHDIFSMVLRFFNSRYKYCSNWANKSYTRMIWCSWCLHDKWHGSTQTCAMFLAGCLSLSQVNFITLIYFHHHTVLVAPLTYCFKLKSRNAIKNNEIHIILNFVLAFFMYPCFYIFIFLDNGPIFWWYVFYTCYWNYEVSHLKKLWHSKNCSAESHFPVLIESFWGMVIYWETFNIFP